MDSALTIVVATYNERQNLPGLVEGLQTVLPEARVLVVDDNSPDGTGEWVRDRMKIDSRIQLLHRDKKLGLGAATMAGMTHALQTSSRWVVTMDADLSHQPTDLLRMWQSIQEDPDVDVVIGSRYVPGGKIENWHWRRRLASRLVNGFSRWVLFLQTHDNSGAFRIYRAAKLTEVDISKVDNKGFAYLEQILLHLKKAGAKFREIPIVFTERTKGISKVNIKELGKNLLDILKLGILRR